MELELRPNCLCAPGENILVPLNAIDANAMEPKNRLNESTVSTVAATATTKHDAVYRKTIGILKPKPKTEK